MWAALAFFVVIGLQLYLDSRHTAPPVQTKPAIPAKNATPPAATAKADDNKIGQAAQLASGDDMQQWMPAILALFGSLIVVVVTAWMNTKALSSQIDALRFEMKALFAEFKLELHHDSVGLQQRVERLEEEERRR
jgi:hypothetical protein